MPEGSPELGKGNSGWVLSHMIQCIFQVQWVKCGHLTCLISVELAIVVTRLNPNFSLYLFFFLHQSHFFIKIKESEVTK